LSIEDAGKYGRGVTGNLDGMSATSGLFGGRTSRVRGSLTTAVRQKNREFSLISTTTDDLLMAEAKKISRRRGRRTLLCRLVDLDALEILSTGERLGTKN